MARETEQQSRMHISAPSCPLPGDNSKVLVLGSSAFDRTRVTFGRSGGISGVGHGIPCRQHGIYIHESRSIVVFALVMVPYFGQDGKLEIGGWSFAFLSLTEKPSRVTGINYFVVPDKSSPKSFREPFGGKNRFLSTLRCCLLNDSNGTTRGCDWQNALGRHIW